MIVLTVPKLGNIDKMNYLKSLVEGPAAAAIKGLSLTMENYSSARKILDERYAGVSIKFEVGSGLEKSNRLYEQGAAP